MSEKFHGGRLLHTGLLFFTITLRLRRLFGRITARAHPTLHSKNPLRTQNQSHAQNQSHTKNPFLGRETGSSRLPEQD
ncbi:hypothetical protein KNP414_05599 [Paenibacillus mucilaginosus KNP414]|uniref:Uncharacterized protein n=1 Tax=Paenibacillus mucilaginosus (strain KNP414) TaxID=1036673 RepID=F8FLJ6_PAEMK|nr:hypothetical protein KNP414_05599 [Paenibacillus mucilaginosus KNP414]